MLWTTNYAKRLLRKVTPEERFPRGKDFPEGRVDPNEGKRFPEGREGLPRRKGRVAPSEGLPRGKGCPQGRKRLSRETFPKRNGCPEGRITPREGLPRGKERFTPMERLPRAKDSPASRVALKEGLPRRKGRVAPREGLPRGRSCRERREGLPRSVVPKRCAEGVMRRLRLLCQAFLFSEHQASLRMQHGAQQVDPGCLPQANACLQAVQAMNSVVVKARFTRAILLRKPPPPTLSTASDHGARRIEVDASPRSTISQLHAIPVAQGELLVIRVGSGF